MFQAGHAALDRRIFEHVAGAGFGDLRRGHGRVMEHLTHNDGLRASELAERSRLTAQSIGELVDDLERQGYVVRRPDPADRRAKRIFLTSRGKDAVTASGVIVRALEKELADLLGEDYERLRTTVLRVLEANAPQRQGPSSTS